MQELGKTFFDAFDVDSSGSLEIPEIIQVDGLAKWHNVSCVYPIARACIRVTIKIMIRVRVTGRFTRQPGGNVSVNEPVAQSQAVRPGSPTGRPL